MMGDEKGDWAGGITLAVGWLVGWLLGCLVGSFVRSLPHLAHASKVESLERRKGSGHFEIAAGLRVA